MQSVCKKLFAAAVLLILLFSVYASPVYAGTTYRKAVFFNVKDYGAKGDGRAADHFSINKTIDAAAAAGGGNSRMAATEVPEKEKGYPDPVMFKPTPAYGFFIRHVTGITMTNVKVNCLNEDQRPAYIFNDVRNADMVNVTGRLSPQAAAFVFNRSDSISLVHCGNIPDAVLNRIDHKEIR